VKRGEPMVRVDDGMRGVVERVEMPQAPGYSELRIVYTDRGEKRIAGKREKWESVVAPPKKLRFEEIALVAAAADARLRSLDKHEAYRWWDRVVSDQNAPHDPELCRLITEHLEKRQ
jgi:hypothetical protein